MVAGVLGFLAWLILRQPILRQSLVQLVPHRYPISFATERQILAPRSVALAAAVFWLLAAVRIVWHRISLSRIITPPFTRFASACFVAIQALIAISVVININSYFSRKFHHLPCHLSESEIFHHWVPQAYQHALKFKQQMPARARVGLYAEGGTFNRYLFSALAYPIQFYDVDREILSVESPSTASAELRKRGVEHILYYAPFSTTEPLQLRRFAGQ
ncbi:MAG: hypothetical protein ACPL7D_08615 [Candidatus Sumerlaeaceae bacterium]